jgi:hypothetical protein
VFPLALAIVAKQKMNKGGRVDGGRAAARPSRPDTVARAAVAHEPASSAPGDKVRLELTISLGRREAERLTAKAIRDGKNLEALVAEILTVAASAAKEDRR